MDNKEIALRLTEAALAAKALNLWVNETKEPAISTANGENAKAIANFYNEILEGINANEESD